MGDLVELVKVCRELDEARAEIAKLRAERQPRPIETAPRDGTEILAWCPRQGQRGAWRVVLYNPAVVTGWRTSDWWIAVTPTHWMPLPAGPEVDDG